MTSESPEIKIFTKTAHSPSPHAAPVGKSCFWIRMEGWDGGQSAENFVMYNYTYFNGTAEL